MAHRAQRMEKTQRQLEAIQGKEQQMKGVPKSGPPYRLHSCFSSLKAHRHRPGLCEHHIPVWIQWGWGGAGESAFPMSSQETEAAGPLSREGRLKSGVPLEAPSPARVSACSEPWDPAAALSPLQRWANGDAWLLLHQMLATSAQALA